jgi:flagellar secretion chaperone FliS
MMLTANPWKSYRQVATQTASPGQLVLMLYDGAIRFLEQALTGFDTEDLSESNATVSNNILRAQAVISELNNSLNLAEGGELAATLRRLYEYMEWNLVQSNINKQAGGIKEAILRLTVLRDAWVAMLNRQTAGAESAPEVAPAAVPAPSGRP